MIELHVVDDGNVGEILEELRRLVEERAVVLVPFNHEVAAAAHPVARTVLTEVPGDPANQHARIDVTVRQQPSSQCRCRRLPMGAGDHN